MASLARPSLLTQCSTCLRRISESPLRSWRPSPQQIRSRSAKLDKTPDYVNVRLLKNIATYGPEGSIVPIKRAVMRNSWLQKQRAEYVPWDQLRALSRSGHVFKRDVKYGRDSELPLNHKQQLPTESVRAAVTEAAEKAEESAQPVTLTRLSPQRSFELLSIFVPASLIFNRVPVSKDTSEPTPSSNKVDLSSPGPSKPNLPEIYGSVSTDDLAAEITKSLAGNDEASKVQVSEADIRFVKTGKTPAAGDLAATNKIKHLGDYDIEIQVRGLEGEEHQGKINRKVRVVV